MIEKRENNGNILHFSACDWGLERISSKEQELVETRLRRKAETDRVREGMSEGCRAVDPERVAPGGAGAVEPQPRTDKP